MRTIAVPAETTVPSDEARLALRDIGPWEPIEGGIIPGEAGILDLDSSLAMVNVLGSQILQDAEMALLAHANLEPGLVLRLLGDG